MGPSQIIREALSEICGQMNLPVPAKLVVEAPKNPSHGDLSTNVALLLAKEAKQPPRKLAEQIAEALPDVCDSILRVEIAGPGFCNITMKTGYWTGFIQAIEEAGASWGHSEIGHGRRALVEYVSANPTGPLHIGHGRGAAIGDSVARILRAAGYGVETEYYLNDAGRQMRLLGKSILLRARQSKGEEIEFPEDCYKGDYIKELASEILALRPELLEMDDPVDICRKFGMEKILAGIKADLARFRCEHQRFFSESSLVDNGAVAKTLDTLRASGRSYEEDGAIWFETISLGDDRNRVLRKSDGTLTYFATDIAYHHDKFDRGNDWLIDVWGADHHGYIPRMTAAIVDMGQDPAKLSILLVQLVKLLANGEVLPMSTRAGEFVTLAQIIDEVGVDAARFMFLSRSCDSPLDFDLEVVKRRSLDNPVYYVQYAHARVQALLRRAMEKGIPLQNPSAEGLSQLDTADDMAILRQLADFEEVCQAAATALAPHYISRYVLDLAARLHSYYAKYTVIQPDDLALSQARLRMLRCAGQVLANGLFLLGVEAPEAM